LVRWKEVLAFDDNPMASNYVLVAIYIRANNDDTFSRHRYYRLRDAGGDGRSLGGPLWVNVAEWECQSALLIPYFYDNRSIKSHGLLCQDEDTTGILVAGISE
jgi:hypothetical protein